MTDPAVALTLSTARRRAYSSPTQRRAHRRFIAARYTSQTCAQMRARCGGKSEGVALCVRCVSSSRRCGRERSARHPPAGGVAAHESTGHRSGQVAGRGLTTLTTKCTHTPPHSIVSGCMLKGAVEKDVATCALTSALVETLQAL
jgi:hypothetical protein